MYVYELRVHLGGSCRKVEKQRKAFKDAGISLWPGPWTGKGHYTNIIARIPDTPEARELLKKVGGTVCRDQGFKESKMERML